MCAETSRPMRENYITSNTIILFPLEITRTHDDSIVSCFNVERMFPLEEKQKLPKGEFRTDTHKEKEEQQFERNVEN